MKNDACAVVGRGQRPSGGGPTCDVRWAKSPTATELYITAAPGRQGTVESDARAMYDAIASILREARAFVVQERLFATSDAMAAALKCRAAALGESDDGVLPTLLCARDGDDAPPIRGAEVHAITGISRPLVIRTGEFETARVFECGEYRYLTASALRAPQLHGGPAQAHQAFQAAHQLLALAGGSMSDVARTWVWMDDILSWYPQFNQVRTAFFRANGMLDIHRCGRMPASTGIGVSPAGARVAIDLFAVWGKPDAVEYFDATGRQRSAYEYGSAFARAARAKTPAGQTVFCSGTAAIDAAGNTCFKGDAAGQISMTLQNVDAVLRDTGCIQNDVVRALIYCATPQVQLQFAEIAAQLPWPQIVLVGDVCRQDLLFEIEVTACRSTGHSSS